MEYFNPTNYSEKHWHIGYYKDNYDIECIAFKRVDGTWDLFYDETGVNGLFPEEQPRVQPFGAFLCNAKEENAEAEFFHWVESILIPFLKKDS